MCIHFASYAWVLGTSGELTTVVFCLLCSVKGLYYGFVALSLWMGQMFHVALFGQPLGMYIIQQ